MDASYKKKLDTQSDLGEMQSQLTYLEGFVSTLEEGSEIHKEKTYEVDKLKMSIKTAEHKLDSGYGVELIFDGFTIEIMKAKAAAFVESLVEVFTFTDAQGWTVNDYGLRSV